MADANNVAQARIVFDTLCGALDHNDWRYEKNEDKMMINCTAQGEDLPMELTLMVDAERMVIRVISRLPLVVPEDKRIDVAIAVSAVNNSIVDGSFDYDVTTGHMFFRMTNSFIESTIGEELIMYLIMCSCHTIDDYNDKFLMLAKNMLPLESFLSALS